MIELFLHVIKITPIPGDTVTITQSKLVLDVIIYDPNTGNK